MLHKNDKKYKPPKKEEQIVFDCLTYQGFGNIIFEPDGNITPDLLVDNEIAIEVRRLNQNQIVGDNKLRGFEEDEFEIYGWLNKIMKKVSDDNFVDSAFVAYFYTRPYPDKRLFMKKVKEILIKHKEYIKEEKEYKVSDNFKIHIFPSPAKLQQQFQYGMNTDGDSGGIVVSLIYENLQRIVDVKEEKTKALKSKYPKWWLAVVDTIGFHPTDENLSQFYDLPKLKYDFDRILLVSGSDPKKFLYLYE